MPVPTSPPPMTQGMMPSPMNDSLMKSIQQIIQQNPQLLAQQGGQTQNWIQVLLKILSSIPRGQEPDMP